MCQLSSYNQQIRSLLGAAIYSAQQLSKRHQRTPAATVSLCCGSQSRSTVSIFFHDTPGCDQGHNNRDCLRISPVWVKCTHAKKGTGASRNLRAFAAPPLRTITGISLNERLSTPEKRGVECERDTLSSAPLPSSSTTTSYVDGPNRGHIEGGGWTPSHTYVVPDHAHKMGWDCSGDPSFPLVSLEG